MNKKLIGILLCMLILATIPTVTATNVDTEPEEKPPPEFLYRGFLIGTVTEKERCNGAFISVRALNVRQIFPTSYPEPQENQIILIWTLPYGPPRSGFVGMHFIFGYFDYDLIE